MNENNINKNVFKDRKGNTKIKPKGCKVNKRTSAYGIAMNKNKILLVKPTWKQEFDLPGGGIETKENLTDCLKREFYEETGMNIEPLSIKPVATEEELFYADDIDKYFDSKQYFFLVAITIIDYLWKADEKEIQEIIWYDIKDINNTKIKHNIKNTHLKVIKNLINKNLLYDTN
jgi:8-oxo-dGTP pyrophosphatase MutT (NUDIX family)